MAGTCLGIAWPSQVTGHPHGQEVLEWAKQKFDADSMRQVARLHFHGNNMAGYNAIAREWSRYRLVEAGKKNR